jgi:RNase P subunit RPR2
MLKEKYSKSEIENKIKDLFSENPSKRDIKKIKSLAMSKNIKLKDYKKMFCKKCFNFFTPNNCEIRIKNGFKRIKCNDCGYRTRYRMK